MEDVRQIAMELFNRNRDLLESHKDHIPEIISCLTTLLKENGLSSDSIREFQPIAPAAAEVKLVKCPHCGGTHVVSNGSSRGYKRYLCRECGKSFSSNTGKNEIRAKNWSKFDRFLEGMIDGLSLERLAEECKINISTAFSWRHKVLETICSNQRAGILKGVIQEDEMYIGASFKGNRSAALNIKKNKDIIPELVKKYKDVEPDYRKYGYRDKAYSRGRRKNYEANEKRGLSGDKVCVATAVDEEKMVIGKPIGRGNVSSAGLEYAFADRIDNDSTFVTDKSSGGAAFARDKEFSHVALKADREARKGVYNLQTVNSFHSRVKEIARTRKSFATKYTEEYIAWFAWLAQNKDKSIDEMIDILENMCYNSCDEVMTMSALNRRDLPDVLKPESMRKGELSHH